MSEIDLEALRKLPAPSTTEITGIRNRLEIQKPAFVFDENYLAILAFGGTIQSAYIPSKENILPVPMNPALERIVEVTERFKVADGKITGTILVAKDSRQITNADLALLICMIKEIPNQRILVTCGTYMLPIITQALDFHFGNGKSLKIVGVTGSWLPPSQEAQDVDFNVGGAMAAINAFRKADKKGIVFAQFHGEIFTGDSLAKLDLHPPGVEPRFALPRVESA